MVTQTTPGYDRISVFKKYGKAFAAVAGAAATVLYGALSGDNHVDSDEAVQIAIAATIAISVWIVPLDPRHRWMKTVIAVILAVLQVLTTLIIGGLDNSEWIALVIAGLTVLGVGVAPAVSVNGTSSQKSDNLAGI